METHSLKKFEWTDELIRELVLFAHEDGYNSNTKTDLDNLIEKFKKSKSEKVEEVKPIDELVDIPNMVKFHLDKGEIEVSDLITIMNISSDTEKLKRLYSVLAYNRQKELNKICEADKAKIINDGDRIKRAEQMRRLLDCSYKICELMQQIPYIK